MIVTTTSVASGNNGGRFFRSEPKGEVGKVRKGGGESENKKPGLLGGERNPLATHYNSFSTSGDKGDQVLTHHTQKGARIFL